MGGHIEMENAPTVMSQHQKHVEDLETNCGPREEINGDELRDVRNSLAKTSLCAVSVTSELLAIQIGTCT